MIKAINIWAFPGGLESQTDIVAAMGEAKEAGFEGIELAIAADGVLTHETPERVCRNYRRAARSIGIEIVGVATGQLWAWSLTDAKKSVQERARTFVTAALERTAWLGAGALLVVPGCVHADFIPDCPELPYDFVYKTARAQLRRLAKVAERCKVTIGVENVWNKFLYSPLEYRDFIDAVGSRRVAAYFDVGNPVAFGVPHHWIPILGRRIKRVHFKDYRRTRNEDGTVAWTPFPRGFDVPIGEGDVNYTEVMKALKKIKYKGPVTAEVLNFHADVEMVRRTSEEMDRVLGRRTRAARKR